MNYAGRISRRILLLVIACMTLGGTAHATHVVIQKKVSTSRVLAGHAYIRGTDLPARNVTVELCSSRWKTVLISTKTDGSGHFSFKKPATGKLFYLRLSAPGLDIYQLRVRIGKHAAKELIIHISVAT